MRLYMRLYTHIDTDKGSVRELTQVTSDIYTRIHTHMYELAIHKEGGHDLTQFLIFVPTTVYYVYHTSMPASLLPAIVYYIYHTSMPANYTIVLPAIVYYIYHTSVPASYTAAYRRKKQVILQHIGVPG